MLYGTTTDFFSSGELHVLDLAGNILSTVAVGVAPGHLALDVRSATQVEERSIGTHHLYPTPADGQLYVPGVAGRGRMSV